MPTQAKRLNNMMQSIRRCDPSCYIVNHFSVVETLSEDAAEGFAHVEQFKVNPLRDEAFVKVEY